MRQFVVERLARSAEETAALGESLAKALLVLRLQNAPPGTTQSERGSRSAPGAPPGQPASLAPPTSPLVFYLCGDLGAGKTTFAQGFVRGCGITDAVRSPTYALLEPYEAGGLALLHLDLYRLRDATELETLGLRDWLASSTAWLIEWPEKGDGRLPPPDVRAELSVERAGHLIRLTGASAIGRRLMEVLENA